MDNLIFAYTRAQAIEDGVLIDVSQVAKEAGIKFPTAVTAAVWADFVKVPDGMEHCQDESGRLWDILWMFRFQMAKCKGSELRFKFSVQNDDRGPREVCLKAVCGPGDTPEPVITIMRPDED